jgi:uncharacterized protein (DUF169 family)
LAMNEQRLDVKGLLEALGLPEEPIGMFYTDKEPAEGFAPKPGYLPTPLMEARGEVEWQEVWRNFDCVMGLVWRARRLGKPAYFDKDRYGCLGGAFYLGFQKPQLDFITYYVSSGIPGVTEGERYLDSPQAVRDFFNTIDPRPAPARFCVFKPLSQFGPGETPEVVSFFARPEIISGLHVLAGFVTNDFEAVCAPFGADCSYIVTWPLHYLAQGRLKAVLGGWDPSARKFLKPDELSFAVPWEMFQRMARRWPESFLTTPTWANVKKKIALSQKAWKEER